jgi:hypothetical protein
MASLHQDIHLDTSADAAWAAVRDFHAVHVRLAPGFVVDSLSDGIDRVVTFASGGTARERLITVDDERRRLVYSVVESRLGLAHHQSSVEIIDAADGCRLLWTTDVLPDAVAPTMTGLMSRGAVAMATALTPIR